jgi:UDP-N-acetyl-2-amino-2-deoxyglucuronate dehydrogenase
MIMDNRPQSRPTFALIGAAGYVAPKHGAAIKAVGGELVAACDVHDAVGWLDRDWPECEFTRIVRPKPHYDPTPVFDTNPPGTTAWIAHPEAKWHVVATENRSHYPILDGLLDRTDVICEKPLVLKVEHLDRLTRTEEQTGHRVYTILNLRHHPEILRAKRVAETDRPQRVTVVYHAPRGPWYDVSWKGDPQRSGGIAFNIGIHVWDALLWMFGKVMLVDHVKMQDKHTLTVTIIFAKDDRVTACEVELSTRADLQPMRGIRFNYNAPDFAPREFLLTAPYSLAAGGLHAICYREILAGRGPGIEDARPSIELAERIGGML